ncbi:MAG: hypothetical protein E5Y58_03650, partial [Mesorhizobium sp.]
MAPARVAMRDLARCLQEGFERRLYVLVIGLVIDLAGENALVCGQEQGALGEFAHDVLAAQEVHHLADFSGVLRVFDGDQRGAARHAGAGGGA